MSLETAHKKQQKPFDFRDFSNLDHSDDAEYLIASMDKMYLIPKIRAIKEHAIKLLELKPGDSAIEIGCGLGRDSEALGELVGPTGQIKGVDSSLLMLEEAKKRSKQKHVEYVYAKADSLPFEKEIFQGVYSDRLLVSQHNVPTVFSEFVRVAKKGGKICVTDIDLGSIVMYPYIDKLTQKVLERFENIILNKYIGRELPILFKSFGLQNIEIFPEVYILQDLDLLTTMIDFPRIIADLKDLKIFTQDEAALILNQLLEANKQGEFMYGITLFTVIGTKV